MSAGSYNAYEILGIDRNADTRTIKKAYAKLVRQYHPEEYPEQWKRIHDAYEMAMQSASAKNQKPPATAEMAGDDLFRDLFAPPETSKLREQKEQIQKLQIRDGQEQIPPGQEQQSRMQTLSAEQENALEDVFGNVGNDVRAQQEEQEKIKKDRIERELQKIRSLAKKRRLRQDDEWRLFFTRRNLLPVISQREFLMGFGDCLASKTIDGEVYEYLNEQLDRIVKYLKKNDVNLTGSDDVLEAVRYVKDRLNTGNGNFQKKRGRVIKISIIVFVVFEFLHPLLGEKYSPERLYQNRVGTNQKVTETEQAVPEVEQTVQDAGQTYQGTGQDIWVLDQEKPQITLDQYEGTKASLQKLLEEGTISQEEYDSAILELDELILERDN